MNASKPTACRAINGHLCWLPSSRLQVIPSTVGRLLSVVYLIKAKPWDLIKKFVGIVILENIYSFVLFK